MRHIGSTFGLGGATQYLIVLTALVYAVQVVSQLDRGPDALFRLGVGWIEVTFGLIAPPRFPEVLWQLVTYMFLHGGLWHILFNMYALWLFGSVLERVWGPKRFLFYYFFTGIGAGLTTIVVSLFTRELSLSIGASGAVYGVLLAFALYFPNQPLFLFLIPVPIPAKYAVLILGALAFFFSATGAMPGIAHLAHLGGLLFGLLYLKGPRALRRWLP